MGIRQCAQFCADFPDDTVEEDGEIIQFGGRGVTEALAEMFRSLGFEATGPTNAQEYGWHLLVAKDRRRIWLQVSDLADYFILATKDVTPIWDRLHRPPLAHGDVLTQLNGELAKDDRFSKVEWFTLETIRTDDSGAKDPVS